MVRRAAAEAAGADARAPSRRQTRAAPRPATSKPAAEALSCPRRPRRLPEPFVEDYLAALLARASQLISAEFHAVVRREGLPVAEWRILASLHGSEPIPVGRLAQLVIAPQPTVTRQLDRMVRKGLVERIAHPGDRRLALAGLTPQGERLAERLIALARAHERRVLSPLGKSQGLLLKRTLRLLVDQHQEPAAGRNPGPPGTPR